MKGSHRDTHPFLLGDAHIWRVTGSDVDGDTVTYWVAAFTAAEAVQFCDAHFAVHVNGVVEVGNLELTGGILSKAVMAYRDEPKALENGS